MKKVKVTILLGARLKWLALVKMKARERQTTRPTWQRWVGRERDDTWGGADEEGAAVVVERDAIGSWAWVDADEDGATSEEALCAVEVGLRSMATLRAGTF